jgi:hypothetical protein
MLLSFCCAMERRKEPFRFRGNHRRPPACGTTTNPAAVSAFKNGFPPATWAPSPPPRLWEKHTTDLTDWLLYTTLLLAWAPLDDSRRFKTRARTKRRLFIPQWNYIHWVRAANYTFWDQKFSFRVFSFCLLLSALDLQISHTQTQIHFVAVTAVLNQV